ncbi:hypothetical protein M5X00_21585 [Paenibacillus alvei]|uniref:hypothetical protein n=1 Tax=Paenibacillus alvei TaxID=44250 RepID=UPI000288AF88|nr:hypothetical protein [Paenibacillus alvei]EJW19204.1 hypothetical protein PAV_1c01750 [Paenibacillus alvei DSM 29]MCY9542654.1 hypothetical protein [Paenibacillus alvei]MCY9704924.1 hypothetical protein [Paenibacillus alvei]MCY9735799.1 hypothetical protein [Paenibacillus alvei]MCY9756838.1 hypothetical protein [Paenibacillus alvei]
MKLASRHLRIILAWCIGIALLVSAFPSVTSAARVNNRFPDKVIQKIPYQPLVKDKEDRRDIPATVVGVTYQQVTNIDPGIALVDVDLPQQQYVIHPHKAGTTTVEYKWTQPNGKDIYHKFTVTVTDPAIPIQIPTVKFINEYDYKDSYKQLYSAEIISFRDLFDADWSQTNDRQIQYASNNGVFSPVSEDTSKPGSPFSAIAMKAGDERWVFKLTTKVGTESVTATYYKDFKVNQEPAFTPDPKAPLQLLQGVETNISIEHLFTDPDNDELFYSIRSKNGKVQVSLLGGDQILISPMLSAEGEDELIIDADDKRGGTVHGKLALHISKPLAVGIAGTYPEVDNQVEMMLANNGEYYMAPFTTYLPTQAELEQQVTVGDARKAELTNAGSLKFVIDQQGGQSKELKAGKYGLYQYDGSTVKLEHAIELTGKEKVIRELKELAAARGESNYNIVDAQQWLFTKGDNNFVRAKIVMALLTN